VKGERKIETLPVRHTFRIFVGGRTSMVMSEMSNEQLGFHCSICCQHLSSPCLARGERNLKRSLLLLGTVRVKSRFKRWQTGSASIESTPPLLRKLSRMDSRHMPTTKAASGFTGRSFMNFSCSIIQTPPSGTNFKICGRL
jgi:hypothetical protein